jgi:hypothetical protein
MTPEERLDRIEVIIEKQNAGIRDLVIVSRTILTSIDRLTEAQVATDEKLNILIDTVDRIIRRQNDKN